MPELLKRFTFRQTKHALFCIQLMTDCVKNEHLIEEINLRHVFKACAGNLKHQNKDIRAAVLELLR